MYLTALELKLLKPFFENNMLRYGLRQLSRLTKINTVTVTKYLKKFLKLGFIVKHTDLTYPTYQANFDNNYFREIKRTYLIGKIYESKLIDHLKKIFRNKTILIYGSVVRGDWHKKSDIDTVVIADEKDYDMTKIEKELSHYEKKIGFSIDLRLWKDWKELNPYLRNNILNNNVRINGEVDVYAET